MANYIGTQQKTARDHPTFFDRHVQNAAMTHPVPRLSGPHAVFG